MPSETIRFEIDSATGKYTGGPHTASADGAVTATYQTDLAGPTGIYNVTATGNLGTTVRAGFVVVAAAPPFTPERAANAVSIGPRWRRHNCRSTRSTRPGTRRLVRWA